MHTKKKKYALGNLDIILLVLFVLFVCVITTSKIIEDDVFIHLVTGKYIVENKTVPSADVFGYISSGTQWITYEWAWQALTYLLWRAGDYVLLSVFKTFIILLIFAAYFSIFNKFKISVPLFVIPAIILCTGMVGRFVIRPQIVSYLCFVIIISIFYLHKYSGYRKTKFIYVLPLIYLIWANIHMGVILGLALYFMFLLTETAEFKFKNGIFRKNKFIPNLNNLKLLYIIFLFSIISVFINPQFTDTYLYVYNMLKMPEINYINEWASPFDNNFISGYYVIIYFVFLILGISILYYSYKTKEIFPAVLYIVLGIFSTKSLRYTSDFSIIIFIPLVIALNYCIKYSRLKSRILNSHVLKAGVAVSLVVIIVNVFNNEVYRLLNIPFRETGTGISDKFFPVSMFGFMKQHMICETGSKPFNSMRIGGYYLWNFTGEKDFADNRCLSGSLMNEYFDISLCRNDFREKIAAYGIDYVVLAIPNFSSMLIEIELNLAAYLAKNPDWKLVYWDDKSFLFVRNNEKFSKIISEFEYKYVTPVNCVYHKEIIAAALKNDSQTVDKEINRRLIEDKNGIIINDVIKYLNSVKNYYSVSK